MTTPIPDPSAEAAAFLEQVAEVLGPTDGRLFRRMAIDRADIETVAAELGMPQDEAADRWRDLVAYLRGLVGERVATTT